ncbi:hypothetical protein PM082_004595 [Marasmius tenuissimus]|nr:hypothetical protein PM082_004595 [Marasmius tenuissimus]
MAIPGMHGEDRLKMDDCWIRGKILRFDIDIPVLLLCCKFQRPRQECVEEARL